MCIHLCHFVSVKSATQEYYATEIGKQSKVGLFNFGELLLNIYQYTAICMTMWFLY